MMSRLLWLAVGCSPAPSYVPLVLAFVTYRNPKIQLEPAAS